MIQKYEIHSDTKIAEVIRENPYLLLLLEHFEISLPVKDLNIKQICAQNNISETIFVAFARLFNGSASMPVLTPTPDDTLTIVKFLKTSHRYYSEQIYPEIMELIERMNQLNNHKEMKLVSVFFANYFKEVTDHLDYENQVFFPYVTRLAAQLKNGIATKSGNSNSVEQYRDHHDDIEEKLVDLKNLLLKYLPVHQDHIIRRKLFFMLSELEFDLKIHSDIEEHILIPFCLKLEKEIKLISS